MIEVIYPDISQYKLDKQHEPTAPGGNEAPSQKYSTESPLFGQGGSAAEPGAKISEITLRHRDQIGTRQSWRPSKPHGQMDIK